MTYALILYSLAFAQVLLIYAVLAPQAIVTIERIFLNKNPEWSAVHAETLPVAALRNRFIAAALTLGMACLLGLFWAARVSLSYSLPVTAMILPMLGLFPLVSAYIWLGYRLIHARIPSTPRRAVSLAPRHVWDYVNPWALGFALLLAALFAVNYISAFQRQLLPAPILIGRGLLFLGLAIVLALAITAAVRRRESFLAILGGDIARRIETGLYVIVIYALIFAWQYLLMSDVSNMPYPPSFVMLCATSVAMQAYGLFFALWARFRTQDRPANLLTLLSLTTLTYVAGTALSLGIARIALAPQYDRRARLAAEAPRDAINLPDVRGWEFSDTAGKPHLTYTLQRDQAVPGGEYWRVDVPYAGHERWDTRARITHVRKISKGDVIEARVWLRSAAPGGARIIGLTQSLSWGWTSIGHAEWQVGPQWRLYNVTGIATRDYEPSGSDFELHLASARYTFDLGPATVRDLGPSPTTTKN